MTGGLLLGWAQTERMSVRVHHHPVGVAAWLFGGNRGTKTRGLVDSGTEVVHAEVEMKLLRVLLAGPLR